MFTILVPIYRVEYASLIVVNNAEWSSQGNQCFHLLKHWPFCVGAFWMLLFNLKMRNRCQAIVTLLCYWTSELCLPTKLGAFYPKYLYSTCSSQPLVTTVYSPLWSQNFRSLMSKSACCFSLCLLFFLLLIWCNLKSLGKKFLMRNYTEKVGLCKCMREVILIGNLWRKIQLIVGSTIP